MDLQRIGIKFFADSSAPVPVRDFIPVFHSWIQKQAIERHMLIDVHNYSHIHNGPGILLVAQEGNFSIDMADGRMGLFYYRKKSGNDFASVLETALAACKLLESDSALGGRLRFRKDEMWIVTNDRLLVPNDDSTFEKLKPAVASALKQLLPERKFTYTRSSVNPKERLTIHVQTA
ncbi:MAG TPA: hypothetical protein VFO86_02635 [Terriglobia bacterium]|nr:hypothetical protein [Terriglobia bacterium]